MPPTPALSLDFSTMTALPSFMTFSRASIGTYRDVDGLIKTAGSGVPRFNVNVINGKRGLFSERASTNLLLHSSEFDNAAWNKTRSSVTANVAVAPDGATTADKIVEDTSTNTHEMLQNHTKATSAITYTASVFAKSAERTRFQFVCNSTMFANRATATFDVTSGTITSAAVVAGDFTNASARMENWGNGWWRCELTFTSDTDNIVRHRVFMHNGTGTNYEGDGTSGLFLWHAQLEAAALASSCIPTGATTVTRAADFARIEPADAVPFINNAAQTIAAEFTLEGAGSNVEASNRAPVGIASDSNNRNRLYNIGGQFGSFSNSGGVEQSTRTLSTGILPAGQAIRAAYAYAPYSFAAAVNGVASALDTGSGVPSLTPNRIGIGNTGVDGFNLLHGTIHNIDIWTTNLTPAQLEIAAAVGWRPGRTERKRLTVSMGVGL